MVEKILLEELDQNFVATGVRFSHGGHRKIIRAQKEVILAAGALQSPKLLELSGIGAQEILETYNLSTFINNPYVGENLQDHVMAGISFEVKDDIKTGDDLLRQNPEAIQSAMTAYQMTKTGPLCSGGVNSYAFMPLIEFTTENGQADLKILLDAHLSETPCFKQQPIQEHRSEIIRSMLENPEVGSAAYFTFTAQSNIGNTLEPKPLSADLQPGNFITLTTALLHSFSTGNVHIASSDPMQAPRIDPRYLSHALDLEIFARHLCYIETIAGTEPLASLLKPNGKRNAPKAYAKSLDAAKEYA